MPQGNSPRGIFLLDFGLHSERLFGVVTSNWEHIPLALVCFDSGKDLKNQSGYPAKSEDCPCDSACKKSGKDQNESGDKQNALENQ